MFRLNFDWYSPPLTFLSCNASVSYVDSRHDSSRWLFCSVLFYSVHHPNSNHFSLRSRQSFKVTQKGLANDNHFKGELEFSIGLQTQLTNVDLEQESESEWSFERKQVGFLNKIWLFSRRQFQVRFKSSWTVLIRCRTDKESHRKAASAETFCRPIMEIRGRMIKPSAV